MQVSKLAVLSWAGIAGSGQVGLGRIMLKAGIHNLSHTRPAGMLEGAMELVVGTLPVCMCSTIPNHGCIVHVLVVLTLARLD